MFRARCDTEQDPRRVAEILGTRLGGRERLIAFVLGDRDRSAKFIGSVAEQHFAIRRTRFPMSWWTPILRGTVRPVQGGSSISLVLVSHPLTRLGVLFQIVLMLGLSALSIAAGLRDPVFFGGGLFVLAIQVTIALTAHFARRRDWPVLRDFVCAALGGSLS